MCSLERGVSFSYVGSQLRVVERGEGTYGFDCSWETVHVVTECHSTWEGVRHEVVRHELLLDLNMNETS